MLVYEALLDSTSTSSLFKGSVVTTVTIVASFFALLLAAFFSVSPRRSPEWFSFAFNALERTMRDLRAYTASLVKDALGLIGGPSAANGTRRAQRGRHTRPIAVGPFSSYAIPPGGVAAPPSRVVAAPAGYTYMPVGA